MEKVPSLLIRGGQALEGEAILGLHGAEIAGEPILSYSEMTEVWHYASFVHVRFPAGEARFDLGDSRRARRFARTIEDAPSPLEALGARKGDTVACLGLPEGWVFRLLAKRRLKPSGVPPASPAKLLIVGLSGPKSLAALEGLKQHVSPDGALWVVYEKGDAEASGAAVRTEDVAAAGPALAMKSVLELHLAPGRSAMKFVAA